MHVNVFDFSELLARSPKRHLEFIRVSAFSVGIYVLDSGATDLQTPHSEDENSLPILRRTELEIHSLLIQQMSSECAQDHGDQ